MRSYISLLTVLCVTMDSEKIPLIAPDCLRKLAKSFTDEDDSVKQQILNLAVKLYQSNPKQTALLFKVNNDHIILVRVHVRSISLDNVVIII
jgi:vesicle coat complex subunit